MATFATRGNSFLAGHVMVEAAPASAATIVLLPGTDLYLNHAATIAALTLQLPGGTRGDEIVIKALSAVTALTWKNVLGTTVTPAGFPTALTAGQKVVLKYTSAGWTNW